MRTQGPAHLLGVSPYCGVISGALGVCCHVQKAGHAGGKAVDDITKLVRWNPP
jgi:hypothetical protein